MTTDTWQTDPQGDKAVRFINTLGLSGDSIGKKFHLRPWQEEPIRKLFGTHLPNGNRQYKTFLYGLPRSCGKTQLASSIILYLMMGQGKQGQQIYSASGDRAQASLLFQAAATSIRQSRTLSQRVTIYEGTKRLLDKKTGNSFQALSSESKLKYGLNPSCVVYDEAAFLGDNEELYTALHTSFLKREDPLEIFISTAGFDPNCWFNKKIWRYGDQILKGTITDDSFLSVIYAASKDDDPLDEEVWKRVIPSLADFTSLDVIRREAKFAAQIPSHLETFRTLYLNIWGGNVSPRWIPVDRWDENEDTTIQIEPGTPCWAGLDLATVRDLAALVLLFKLDEGYYVKPFAWVPLDSCALRQQVDNVPYKTWADQGYLKGTPGEVIDFDVIKQDILQLNEVYPMQLYCDPWNATMLCTQLQKEGVRTEFFRQGFGSLNLPSKYFEKLVCEQQIHHDGNPVLRWCVSNVVAEEDQNKNIKPSKKRSYESIDLVVAMIMAIGGCIGGEMPLAEPQLIVL